MRNPFELATLGFSELIVPVFPTTSMVAVGLPNTGKYDKNKRTVGDRRGKLITDGVAGARSRQV
jgi:hypothetical protein